VSHTTIYIIYIEGDKYIYIYMYACIYVDRSGVVSVYNSLVLTVGGVYKYALIDDDDVTPQWR